jgi:hypothetical protein
MAETRLAGYRAKGAIKSRCKKKMKKAKIVVDRQATK